ncbi:Uricase-2 isozyme 1 [Porphyridium purpureum]|uniref:Uricase n=1 Tax=Porphyridium purpureum TaxID=35688 RepID=A0A5J4YZY6_PORPP|nr:Uricase-2 isozyme 1 [Porphyridium purpureum]|eukprot:POR1569..scf208_2
MGLGENSHGKSRVRVAKVVRHGDGTQEIHEYNVAIQLYGGTERSFTHGDNSMVVATDTCKNHVYLLAKQHSMSSPEQFALDLADRFLDTYAFVTQVRVRVAKAPWQRVAIGDVPHRHGFVRGSGTHAAEVHVVRGSGVRTHGREAHHVAELLSKLEHVDVLKTTQSGWDAFLQDKYTTLPPTTERLLATTVECTWKVDLKTLGTRTFDYAALFELVKRTLFESFFGNPFTGVYSPGVQATMYAMGEAVLQRAPHVTSVTFSLPNIHFLPCNIPAFAKAGIAFDDDVYIPTDEPHGLIKCTVTRATSKL